jgi:hypothetical protein
MNIMHKITFLLTNVIKIFQIQCSASNMQYVQYFQNALPYFAANVSYANKMFIKLIPGLKSAQMEAYKASLIFAPLRMAQK